MAGDNRDLDRRLHWLLFGEEGGDATPAYTTSLEAAFDLMRRRFPGWWFSIRTTDERPEVWIAIDLRHPTYGWHFPDSWRELPDDPAEDGPGLAVSFPFGTPPALCMSLAMANVARDIDLGRNPQADPDILDHLAGRREPFDLSVLPVYREDAAISPFDEAVYALPTPGPELDREIHEALLDRPFDGAPYSTSIDAALALADEVLPGWAWRLGECWVSDDVLLQPNFSDPEHGEDLRARWGHIFDVLTAGPGLDCSYAPPGRPALGMCTVLAAVEFGLREGREPDDSEIWKITSQEHPYPPSPRLG
jgi:hypothetical protein